MKANELRIGNWVKAFKSNESVYIINIYGSSGLVDVISNGIQHFRISISLFTKPTPLTPEILVKMGFKELPNGCFELDRFGIMKIPNTGMYPDIWEFGISCSDLADIQYVHQLQNLYFVLTGTELEFTL